MPFRQFLCGNLDFIQEMIYLVPKCIIRIDDDYELQLFSRMGHYITSAIYILTTKSFTTPTTPVISFVATAASIFSKKLHRQKILPFVA